MFLLGKARIHLDEVEKLGSFMELEVVLTEDQKETESQRVAIVLMEQLGVRQEDLVEQAYVDLWKTVRPSQTE